MNVPDVAGFQEAQAKLVSGLGSDVVFGFNPSLAFASTVYIAENGLPLDPSLDPAGASAASGISVRATVIRRVPGLVNAGIASDAGVIPEGKLWLRIPVGYPSGIVSAATVLVHGELFAVQRFVPDGIGGSVDRVYVECELVDTAS